MNQIKDKRIMTGIYELARAKLKQNGAEAGDIRTRIGVIKCVESIIGPCPDGQELKFLSTFVSRNAAPARTHINRGEYKPPIEMQIAKRRVADYPVPLSMNKSSFKGKP